MVTKVSDPHGSTADLDTHPTSHYSSIEIAVLNLVTKVSDPHGLTADLDTHPTSHY